MRVSREKVLTRVVMRIAFRDMGGGQADNHSLGSVSSVRSTSRSNTCTSFLTRIDSDRNKHTNKQNKTGSDSFHVDWENGAQIEREMCINFA